MMKVFTSRRKRRTKKPPTLMDREGRLGIGGHIHVQMDRLLPAGWRAINIGSVGMSFDQPGYAQYGVFTFENGDVNVDLRAIPYDLDAAIEDLRQVGFPTSNGWRIGTATGRSKQRISNAGSSKTAGGY
ncbi:MAG: hypothetical protein U0670_18905 [Anaerolineae bacterium]